MPADSARGPWIALIRLLPRSLLSHAVGRLASVPLPRALRSPAWRAFARAVGADLGEVAEPLDRFDTLQSFFTRRLVEGARPTAPGSDAFVAPCDGFWGASGRVESGRLVQVKGREYTAAALLDDAALAERFEGGAFATFYLSPRDYHRFHAPAAARVLRAVHVPGALWPVNRIGVEGIPNLFAVNERICAHMATDASDDTGALDLVLVAVGATLVGKVHLAFDDLSTRRPGAARTVSEYPGGVPLAKGQEWGRFEFGSTIVMVAAPGLVDLDAREPGTVLRLGERIGSLRSGGG